MMDIADLLGPEPEEPQKPEGYEAALDAVVAFQRASTSWLQRKLGIGYNKAAALIGALEEDGVVSPADDKGKRSVLIEADTEIPEEDPDSGRDRRTMVKRGGNTNAAIVQALHRPVSISFLSDVTHKDRKVITRRLSNLTPMGFHRGSIPLYDFRQALELIVTPKVDPAELIRKMGTNDLPIGLQKDVWDARLKQQQWMIKAGELWPTEDVMEVLGEAFQRLKTTTQLWVDQLADSHDLPNEVRQDLLGLVDGLQKSLHETLVEMPAARETQSQAGEIEGTALDV